jgi:ABC-2 type transport system ATP-binding protein
MVDIEKVCSRIMIIDHGHIVYDGNADKMRTEYGTQRTLVVEFEEVIADFSVPQATLTHSQGRKKWFVFNRFETSPSTLITFIGSHYPILDLVVEEPEIESIVRTIYQA